MPEEQQQLNTCQTRQLHFADQLQICSGKKRPKAPNTQCVCVCV